MSVTVTTLARVPTALGVNVTVNVHFACASSEEVHGVVPPGTAAKSPLPVMVGVTVPGKLFVIVTVWDALLVATVCAAKVSDAGEKESGNTTVPFASSTWAPTVALSLTVIPPLIVPLEPIEGMKATAILQLALAARFSPDVHGVVCPPATVKNPDAEKDAIVTLPVLTFLMVTVFEALVPPTTSPENVRLVGLNVSGGVAPPVPVPDSGTSS